MFVFQLQLCIRYFAPGDNIDPCFVLLKCFVCIARFQVSPGELEERLRLANIVLNTVPFPRNCVNCVWEGNGGVDVVDNGGDVAVRAAQMNQLDVTVGCKNLPKQTWLTRDALPDDPKLPIRTCGSGIPLWEMAQSGSAVLNCFEHGCRMEVGYGAGNSF